MNEETNVQNAELQDPIPADPETKQESATGDAAATAPQEQKATEGTSASSGEDIGAASESQAEAPPAPFITVKYNHEDKGFTQEEADQLIRHGLYYDGLYNKLDYIAAQKDTTVDALIEGLMQSMEDAKRAELKERVGDDENLLEDLMTLYRNGQKEKYDKVVADRKSASEQAAAEKEKSLNERISDEFIAMKKDFPELTDYASLPSQVRQAAADGMPLAYAYLMYKHTEAQKVAAAQQQAEEAAQKSSGSLATDDADGKTEAENRYLNALWGR